VMAGWMVVVAFSSFGSAAAQDENAIPANMTVQNNRAVAVVVYLERGPFDTRLGTVAPKSTAVLDLPKYVDLDQTFEVFVHPEGGLDLSAGPVTLRAGEKLAVLVPLDDSRQVSPPPREMVPNPGLGNTTVTVENPRDQEVTIFMERGIWDVRLGVVPPRQEQTLTIPSNLIGDQKEVELFVHPEGGLDLTSQVFELKPGDHLLLKVPVK